MKSQKRFSLINKREEKQKEIEKEKNCQNLTRIKTRVRLNRKKKLHRLIER